MNSLYFLREEPPENWIDNFVDQRKFLESLDSDKADSNKVVYLMVQFAGQAQVVDKEIEMMVQKEFDEDDLAYNRRKAAKLWLCALSCFAAINWDFDIARKQCNALVMQVLMVRLVSFCFQDGDNIPDGDASSLVFDRSDNYAAVLKAPERIFAAWLYAKWILMVDVDDRFPEVVVKPTVSNPANQFDPNLALGEQIRNCVTELRLKAPDAQMLIEFFLSGSADDFIVPTKECFLEDLLKELDARPEIPVIMEPPVLPIPRADFKVSSFKIKHLDWIIATRYLLLRSHFACGRIADSKNQLLSIVKDWPRRTKFTAPLSTPAALVFVDGRSIAGYCSALNVEQPREVPTKPTNQLYSDISEVALQAVASCSHSLTRGSECERLANTSTSVGFLAENLFDSYMKKVPATRNTLAMFSANAPSFQQVAKAFLRMVKGKDATDREKKVIALATLRILATTLPAFAQEVVKLDSEMSDVLCAIIGKPSVRKAVAKVPEVSVLQELLSSTSSLWRALVSYDANEIKMMLRCLETKFTLPYRFQASTMVADAVFPVPADMDMLGFNYISLLLGKLEHLAKIGDIHQWNDFCNTCVKELGALGRNPKVHIRFVFDALRVQLDNWHAMFSRISTDPQFLRSTQELQMRVKGLIQNQLGKNENPANPVLERMLLQIVTFFINTNEWEFIMKITARVRSGTLDVAKVLSAFITHNEPAKAKWIAEETWWQIMHPTFEDHSNKRRSDGSAVREQTKQLISRLEFLEMIRLIMEPRSLAFLLSFVGKLFNAVKTSSGTPEGATRVFVEHVEYWQNTLAPSSSSTINMAFTNECLEVLLRNALTVNPINAFWLRMCADFHFANERYEDALTKYLEACVACSNSLSHPLPDNVVDDVMWYKMQRCLRSGGFETLAAFICQQMRDPVEHYVFTAKALLESEGATLDASTAYFPLLHNVDLLEFINDAFERLGLTLKGQLLVRAVSVPEMNSHNPTQNERFRRKERFMRILCSHIFRIHL